MLVVMLLFFTAAGGTLAYFNIETRSNSGVSTAKVAGTIVETFDQTQKAVMPGDTIQKIVHVRNDGNTDMLVRVRIEKNWRNGASTTNLSGNNIVPAFHLDRWIDGGDGYYYYSGILKPGTTTERSLFDSFTVSAAGTGNEYQGKTANINVTMEAIQATEGALQTWGKTYAQLKITAPQKTNAPATNVSFVDSQAGFRFEPATTDLFASFKQILPGETRTQRVDIRNSYSKQVEILLRAELAQQTTTTPEKLALINRLLREQTTMKITDSDGRTIYQGAAWGNYTAEGTLPNTMKYNISLGRFDPQQARSLTVDLQLSPQVDNEYQDLLGMVRWVFVANDGPEPSTTPVPTPTPVQPVTPTPTTWPTATPTAWPTATPTAWPTATPTAWPTKTAVIPTATPYNPPATRTNPPSSWRPKTETPKTGDESALFWLLAEFFVAATAMTILIVKYKKSSRGSKEREVR